MFGKFKSEVIRQYKGEKVNLLEVKFHYTNGFTFSISYWVEAGELPPYEKLAERVHIQDCIMDEDGNYYKSTNYSHFTIEKIGVGELLENVDWQYYKVNDLGKGIVRKLN